MLTGALSTCLPARAGKRQVLLSPTAEAVEDPSALIFVHPLWEDPPNNEQVVPKVIMHRHKLVWGTGRALITLTGLYVWTSIVEVWQGKGCISLRFKSHIPATSVL